MVAVSYRPICLLLMLGLAAALPKAPSFIARVAQTSQQQRRMLVASSAETVKATPKPTVIPLGVLGPLSPWQAGLLTNNVFNNVASIAQRFPNLFRAANSTSPLSDTIFGNSTFFDLFNQNASTPALTAGNFSLGGVQQLAWLNGTFGNGTFLSSFGTSNSSLVDYQRLALLSGTMGNLSFGDNQGQGLLNAFRQQAFGNATLLDFFGNFTLGDLQQSGLLNDALGNLTLASLNGQGVLNGTLRNQTFGNGTFLRSFGNFTLGDLTQLANGTLGSNDALRGAASALLTQVDGFNKGIVRTLPQLRIPALVCNTYQGLDLANSMYTTLKQSNPTLTDALAGQIFPSISQTLGLLPPQAKSYFDRTCIPTGTKDLTDYIKAIFGDSNLSTALVRATQPLTNYYKYQVALQAQQKQQKGTGLLTGFVQAIGKVIAPGLANRTTTGGSTSKPTTTTTTVTPPKPSFKPVTPTVTTTTRAAPTQLKTTPPPQPPAPAFDFVTGATDFFNLLFADPGAAAGGQSPQL